MSKKYLDSLITNLLNFTNMETLSDRQSDVFKKYYLPFFYDSLYGFGFEFKYDEYGYLSVNEGKFTEYYKKFYGKDFQYLSFEEITELNKNENEPLNKAYKYNFPFVPHQIIQLQHMNGWANDVIKSCPEYQMFVNLLIMDDGNGNNLLEKLKSIHFKLKIFLKTRLPPKLNSAMAREKSKSVRQKLKNLQKSLAEGVEPDAANNSTAHLFPLGGGGRKSKRNITRKNTKKNAMKNNKTKK